MQVSLSGNMEEWLRKLLEVSHTSVYQLVLQALDSDLPILEELVCCQVTQVACVAIHHQWTKDCEQVGRWAWLNPKACRCVQCFDYMYMYAHKGLALLPI